MTSWNRDLLWRTGIGFDRLFDLIDATYAPDQARDAFPPCDITKIGDDRYRLSLAVAGYKPDQIDVTFHQGQLVIAGRPGNDQTGQAVLYRGIGTQAFERRFALADFVEVVGADLQHGLLEIELERRVPEAMKPRRIPLGGPTLKRVGEEKAAA